MGIIHNLGASGRRFQYVPNLRTKAGEVTALANLQPSLKPRVVPILQITPTLSASFATDFATAWAGLPVVLDGSAQTAASGSASAFNSLFSALGTANLPVIPLADMAGPPAYASAVAACLQKYAAGAVLRVRLHEINPAPSWITSMGGTPGDTDLLIDVGHVADVDPTLLPPFIVNTLQTLAPNLTAWRSLTLTSSAALKDASGLSQGPNLVPRRDWQLWTAISSAFPTVHYGDYGIAHRDLSEAPGYAMANATVSPRYTIDADWILMKGRSTRGASGQPMAAQYHSHALALSKHQEFGGVPGCWGDAEIAQIANRSGVGKSGSRETWVSIGLNRHISLVCHRLP